jgi:hypothetical protein
VRNGELLCVIAFAAQGLVSARSESLPPQRAWQESGRRGNDWSTSVHTESGGDRLRWTFPWRLEAGPPNACGYERSLPVPKSDRVDLRFTWADDFAGPTAGYHFLTVAIDGVTVWGKDVAHGGTHVQSVSVEATEHCRGRKRVTICISAETRKPVTNFGVVIQAKNVRLAPRTSAASVARAYIPPPADLPLPLHAPNGADWTAAATILQPWGRTQHEAMHACGDLPQQLAREYGFNTIIVLPPDAHRFTAPADHHLSDAEFRRAIAAYRKAGFRFLLYSSIMHIGHSRAWEEGDIERDHPDWAQRDAEGGVIRMYGRPWLCPSTGALDFAIAYTIGIVKDYAADGVMLDNNQFMKTPGGGGPTCYCANCRTQFKAYVHERYGDAVEDTFGVQPDAIDIPAFPGPLMNLWIHFRNRVWARANERFREALRAVRPELIFFANTQYGRNSWDLATDLQYVHEDVMLSESRGLDSLAMSAKLTLGTALAHGRPLWNYIGTFREKDFRRLRPAREVASITAPALAQQAPPWIVYYGFRRDNAADEPARQALSRLLTMRRDHPALFLGLKPWNPVGVLFDTRSRNYSSTALIPVCVKPLLTSGLSLRGIHTQNLTDTNLAEFQVIAAPNTVCLSDAETGVLLAWLRQGGALVTTGNMAKRDELGRERPGEFPPESPGRGRILCVANGAAMSDAVIGAASERLVAAGVPSGHPLEFRAYTNNDGNAVLHIVNHGPALETEWTLLVPESFAGSANNAHLLRPNGKPPERVLLSRGGRSPKLVLPGIDVYAVVHLQKHPPR